MRGVTIHTDLLGAERLQVQRIPVRRRAGLRSADPAVLHRRGARLEAARPTSVLGPRRVSGRQVAAGSTTSPTAPRADSIDVTDPYPAPGHQCVSPAGIATCVTDLQLQQELDRVIQAHDPAGRGLHDLWFVFLPPDVDTCISPGRCGTNAFAGYHSPVQPRPRGNRLREHPRHPDRGHPRSRPGSAGQPGGRERDRHRRARGGRGDHRSRGRGLDGPERVRGRRQMRERPQIRHAARLRDRTARRTTS